MSAHPEEPPQETKGLGPGKATGKKWLINRHDVERMLNWDENQKVKIQVSGQERYFFYLSDGQKLK